ncbi:MAG TPA: DinB family protein [Tepidisphaeraceae bacterium]|nr:DinB family protein [Tepidisphaeraceae bacterium]
MEINSLSAKQVLFTDLDRELDVTRTVLDRLPEAQFNFKPHEKSMSLGRLASHVADLPNWVYVTLAQDELDAATAERLPESTTHADLLARFDRHADAAREAAARFDIANLNRDWTMRNGPQVIVTRPRLTVYRLWCLNHLVHHRAQLCLYLRLLNVPVPTVYFNTADDPTFVFA